MCSHPASPPATRRAANILLGSSLSSFVPLLCSSLSPAPSSLARPHTQTTVVINTVLRAAAVLSSVPPFSVVVDRTTLVTVPGVSVVMVAVVGAVGVVGELVGPVVVGEVGVLSVLGVDVVTLAGVVGEADAEDVGDGDVEFESAAEAVDVADSIPLLSILDNPTLDTKMRGMGGTKATSLVLGPPSSNIVLVTMIIVVIVLVVGEQAQPGSSCGRAISPKTLPPMLA